MGRIALCCLATAACAARGALPQDRPAACPVPDWSRPVVLEDVARRVGDSVVQFARVALGDSTGYLVANLIPSLNEPVSIPGRLLATGLDGTFVGQPDGAFAFGYPQAVVDAAGTLHVVWGEPDAGTPRDSQLVWPSNWVRRLMYATYRPSTGWSTVREIDRNAYGLGLAWRFGTARLRIDAAGRPHVITRQLHVFPDSAVHVRVEGERVRRVAVPVPLGEWVDFAFADSTGLVVAMMGFDESSGNANVYFMHSDDLGGRWTPPSLIPGSVDGAARETQIVYADGRVHVIWATNLAGRPAPADAIRHVVSGDHGITWSGVQELRPPNGFSYLDAVADACGRIHVAFNSRPQGLGSGEFGYVRWEGSWSEPSLLYPELVPVYVELSPGRDGTLYLFGAAQRRSDGAAGLPVPTLLVGR